MLKTKNKIATYVVLLFLLAGCLPQNDLAVTAVQPHCIEQQSVCSVEIVKEQLNILFNVEQIIAENSFNVTIDYRGSKKIDHISGFIEGEDMFMGKIPLFFTVSSANTHSDRPADKSAKNDGQQFVAETMLGSCSQDKMLWRLWVTITMADNPQLKYTRSITFSSSRY